MKISVRKKIILSFLIGVFLGAIIWLLSYHYHGLLNQQLKIIEKRHALFNAILEARRYEKNYFLTLDEKNISYTLIYVDNAENALMEIINISEQYPFTYKWPLANEFKEWLADLNNYKISLTTLFKLHEKAGSTETTNEIREKIEKHQSNLHLLGRKITTYVERTVAIEYKTIEDMIIQSKYYHLTTFVALCILASITALFLIFNVNRPLKAIEKAIYKIAKGDYTNVPSISTGDEFEHLVDSLNNMINELNKRSEISLQTEKMASLGTLTSGVAHELNNPLNNISTAVQIVIEELDDGNLEYKRELLMRTEKQVERARDTVKALLEFSREVSFSPKRLHVENLIYQTLKLIKGEVPPNVTISVEVPEDLEATMDPRRIQHVMINLIINAVQAMEEGGELKIKAFRQGNNGLFCLQFQDTGAGIPEEVLPKIFDPFFTTKEVGKGSGLGLSVCHGVIEQHGGTIEVASTPGRGTTFSVFLPT